MMDPWAGLSDERSIARAARRLSDRIEALAQEVAMQPASRARIASADLAALDAELASQQRNADRLPDGDFARAVRTMLSESKLDLDYVHEETDVTSLRLGRFLSLMRGGRRF